MLPSTLFSDFDGTITEMDTGEAILARFGRSDWREFDRRFEAGQISLEECLRSQFGSVKASEDQLWSEVSQVRIRPGFPKLLEYCHSHGVEFIVVSAGLDFIIRRILNREGISDIRLVAPEAKSSPSGIRLRFPPASRNSDFKTQLVKQYGKPEKRVWYVGDGTSDYAAASAADLIFAIRDSELAGFCRRKSLKFEEIEDFHGVISALERDQ